MTIGLNHYLILSAIVFACGMVVIVLKRNAIGILMGVELILNSANINLVALNKYWHATPGAGAVKVPAMDGQVFALFVIVIAAAEAAVALAIFLNYYNNFASVDVEKAKAMKG